MLLTTDGTVSTLLEACTGEPIVTPTTRQSGPATLEQIRIASGCWWQVDVARPLELQACERLLARRVSLRGAHRGIAYVVAEALVVPDRLPEMVAHRLRREGRRSVGCSPKDDWNASRGAARRRRPGGDDR